MDSLSTFSPSLGDAYLHASAPPLPTLRRYLARIAVRARDRIVIVPTADITRIDAEGNYVRLWADRSWLYKDTLTRLCARLDPAEFLRVHRSHAVHVKAVRELVPRSHGEFRMRLADGTELTSGRMYREAIRAAFALE